MYKNRTHVRNVAVKARFNEHEAKAIEAIAILNEVQPAVFVRQLVMDFLSKHDADDIQQFAALEGTHESLRRLCA